jgi:hypothetical protein
MQNTDTNQNSNKSWVSDTKYLRNQWWSKLGSFKKTDYWPNKGWKIEGNYKKLKKSIESNVVVTFKKTKDW